ncbi:hypothetical protein [Thauera sinica]|uniref:Uncharacterized protein n=1 Tax=Thauera sinica TaxID=2665146 RepID=A0ABW1AWQ1_9RHOO|nr:hypothetical protein [Thauera sp. K11]
MSDLQTIHGRIVDLRRHVNVHLYHLRPCAPSDRYELWIRCQDGSERKFTLHTRCMPARRGHEVSLIVALGKTPRVLGLANWTALDGANYVRTDPPALLRPRDGLAVLALGTPLVVTWGAAGVVLSVPVALVYLLAAGVLRAGARIRRAAQVDMAIDREAGRIAGPWRGALH